MTKERHVSCLSFTIYAPFPSMRKSAAAAALFLFLPVRSLLLRAPLYNISYSIPQIFEMSSAFLVKKPAFTTKDGAYRAVIRQNYRCDTQQGHLPHNMKGDHNYVY